MAVVCDFSHESGGAGGARDGMLSVPEKGKEVQRLAIPPEAGFKFGLKVQPPHPLLSTPSSNLCLESWAFFHLGTPPALDPPKSLLLASALDSLSSVLGSFSQNTDDCLIDCRLRA